MNKFLTILIFILLSLNVYSQPWNQLTSGTTENLNSIHFINDTLGFVAGNGGAILKTTDGGIVWNDIYTLNNDSFYSIHAIDEDTIYIGGNSGLHKTIDGGVNWTYLNFTSQVQEINFVTAQKGYVYINSGTGCTTSGGGFYVPIPGGKYFETNDFGLTWTQLGYQMVGNSGIQFTSDSVGYILGDRLDGPGPDCAYGGRGEVRRTTDGGLNWTTTTPFVYEGPPDFHFINDTLGYFGLGGFTKTYDGGITNTTITTNIPGTGWSKDVKFTNEHEGYLTRGTKILKTTSDAIAWSADYSGLSTLSELCIIDTTIAYCIGDSGVILKKMLNPVTSPDTIYSIAADTMSINFGDLAVGLIDTISYSFRVYNTGTEDLQVSLTAPIGFEIKLNGTPNFSQTITNFNLGTQLNKWIDVRFLPTANQVYSDSIEIISNATNSPLIKVPVLGEGKQWLNGIIASDTLLCADTINIGGNVIIDSNVTVTICPGTIVLFHGTYNFDVRGKLIAISNITDSIVFTAEDIVNGWSGITFNNSSSNDTSIFQYCRFEYAFTPIKTTAYHTTIIKNCIFQNNTSWTISINNSIGYIENCIINDGHIRIDSSNYFLIKRNNIIGGSLSLHSSRGIIERNKIYNSPAANVISINYSSSNQPGDNVRIINNLMFNNSGTGINCHLSSKINIINNTIVNTQSGIQFYSSTNCEIKNNIIRKYDYSTHLSLYANSPDSSLIIENNNIKGRYIFEYNLVDGNTGTGNIDVSPQFINPILAQGPQSILPNYDWSLLPASKCINAGTVDTTGLNIGSLDLDSNDRIYGSAIDMGAFESKAMSPFQGNICDGDSLLLYTTALDTSPSTYQWSLNGSPLLGENNDTLSINPFLATNEGLFSCNIYFSNDTILGYYSTVNIDSTQPIIISQNTLLGNSVIGDSVVLFVETMNTETYQWYRDSVLISDESDSLLIFPILFSMDTGHYYHCVVSNGCGSIQSDNIIGIESYNINDNIKIYPNPTTHQLTIESEKLTFNEIEVITITGLKVKSFQQNIKTINVSDLPTGIYFIKLFSEEKVFTKKFVKQ